MRAQRRTVRNAVRLAAPMLVLTMVLAACSSNGGTSSTSSSGGSSGGSSTAHGTPIKVGYVGTFSGSLPGFIAVANQLLLGYQAYIGYTNAHGGIDGHPLKLVVGDDSGDPQTGLAQDKRLVGNGITALVGQSGASFNAGLAYIQQSGVPFTGPLAALNPQFASTPVLFTTQSTYLSQGSAVAKYVVNTMHAKKIAVWGYATPSGDEYDNSVVNKVKTLGGDIVSQGSFSQGGTVDYDGIAAKLASAKPDVVVFFSSITEAAGILKSAQTAGLTTKWFWGPGATTPQLASLVGGLAEGTYGENTYETLTSSSPAVEQFLANVKQYGTVSGTTPSSYTELAYCAMEFTVDGLKASKGTYTPASLLPALQRASGAYGLFPAFQATPTNHILNTSIEVDQFRGSSLVAASKFISGS